MSKLTGLSKTDCAAGCSVNGCVIADGHPHCMHPLKGGVPFNFKNDPAIQKLYTDACSALGVKNKHALEGSTT
jgi:hypothetical protein